MQRKRIEHDTFISMGIFAPTSRNFELNILIIMILSEGKIVVKTQFARSYELKRGFNILEY
jgi:hypothetical protein